MKNEIEDLLNKLGTQVDGVESYLRRLHKIGERPEFYNDENLKKLGQVLRVRTDLAMDTGVDHLREDILQIEEILRGTF